MTVRSSEWISGRFGQKKERFAVLKIIGLVVKDDAEARATADTLSQWFVSRGISVLRKESIPPVGHPPAGDLIAVPPETDCVVVLGGDGTLLSAARWIGDQEIPILGIKFGEVGFLSATTGDQVVTAAEALLGRPLKTEPRMRLEVKVIQNSEEILRETVLNDVVINKGALARLAHIVTSVDDHYLTTYSADGLIIATPTGSTAYSLAAGGPVIHPAVAGIILTPICPFTLTNRPLIVPDSVCIELRLDQRYEDTILTMDGQSGFTITEQTTIRVCKSDHPLQMITLPGQQYYDVLKAKLSWSGGRI